MQSGISNLSSLTNLIFMHLRWSIHFLFISRNELSSWKHGTTTDCDRDRARKFTVEEPIKKKKGNHM
jgi:hypothetical protein